MKFISLIVLSFLLFNCVRIKSDQKILYYKLDLKSAIDTCDLFTYTPIEDFLLKDTSKFIFYDIDHIKHKVKKLYYFDQLSEREEIVKKITKYCTSYFTTTNYKYARIKVHYLVKRGHKREIFHIYFIDKAMFIWRNS